MRRAAFTIASVAIALWCAYGQVSRDAYRLAYRNWRQADPNLEHDAGAGGPLLAQRADQLTEQARNYGVERSAFLQQLADETQRGLAWLESSPSEAPPDTGKQAAARVAAEMVSVKRNIDAYANDPDLGLQRVRMMLERENLALASLNNAILERQRTAEVASAATVAVRAAQSGALNQKRDLLAGLKQATAESDRERDAWVQYYRLVADAARGPENAPATSLAPPPVVTLPAPAPPVRTAPQVAPPPETIAPAPPTTTPAVTPTAPPAETVTSAKAPPAVAPSPSPAPPPSATTPAVTPIAPPSETVTSAKAPPPPPAHAETPVPPEAVNPTPAADVPLAPRPSITPVPLVRYTGSWTLPLTSPIYHGPQPEAIELVVNAENGKASGTLAARFKLPPGSSGDPTVSFNFSGDLRNTRNQVFELHASDGSGGRIELIPGPAFNLLEINFLVEAGPGKIRQANAILIKK